MNLKYWFGKEIEGRFYGLESAFIVDDLTEEEFNHALTVNHLLIGVPLIDKINKGGTFITWSKLLHLIQVNNKFVTLEAKPEQLKFISQEMKLRSHILLWLDVPELNDIKSTDSVKLVTAPYEIYATSLMNCQKVTKHEYTHDRFNGIDK